MALDSSVGKEDNYMTSNAKKGAEFPTTNQKTQLQAPQRVQGYYNTVPSLCGNNSHDSVKFNHGRYIV